MARRVNQVQDVVFAPAGIVHLDGMTFDGDAAFPFQFHVVQHLCLQVFSLHRLCIFEQTVGQRTFPVVNMSDNTEIANVIHLRNFIFFGVQR